MRITRDDVLTTAAIIVITAGVIYPVRSMNIDGRRAP
jgi:hypothetical protein